MTMWRTIRWFRTNEREEARLAARRVAAENGHPVRVEGCAGRGLRLTTGEDERHADLPVDHDRRQR